MRNPLWAVDHAQGCRRAITHGVSRKTRPMKCPVKVGQLQRLLRHARTPVLEPARRATQQEAPSRISADIACRPPTSLVT